MKKVILLTITCLINYWAVWGQTSEEEYLYVTYGYKEQLLKGLDDKKGYFWKPLVEYKFTDESGKLLWKKSLISKFEFEGLFRENETVPCAIVAIYKEKENMKKMDGTFMCIPHEKSDQDIIGKTEEYFKNEIDFEKSTLRYYTLALGKLSIALAQHEKYF